MHIHLQFSLFFTDLANSFQQLGSNNADSHADRDIESDSDEYVQSTKPQKE